MSNKINWKTDIPIEPTDCLILVSHISSKTPESTIKDFFSFCGEIKSFEMQSGSGLILFEQPSSAKTATLLSQAEIDEQSIQVDYYFKKDESIVLESLNEKDVLDKESMDNKEGKSVSGVMSKLLASGYILTEGVIARGIEFDEKHGVTVKLGGYLNKVSHSFNNVSQRFITTHEEHHFRNTKAGSKLHGYASRVANKVNKINEEAKKIVAEKKGI